MSIFSKVKAPRVPSNTFSLSHERKFSFNMGELVPTLVMEVVPGDKITCRSSELLRLSPLISPMMHRVTSYTHYFYVPNRILWENWQDFITGGEDGEDTSVFPKLDTPVSLAEGSLMDYMGVPTGVTDQLEVSAMPFAAYQKIYDEYYRDENLIARLKDDIKLVDGPQPASTTAALTSMRTRAWQHDYFTSALPWAQKGAEATLPLGTSAPVTGGSTDVTAIYSGSNPIIRRTTDNAPYDSTGLASDSSGYLQDEASSEGLTIDPNGTLRAFPGLDWSADLSAATAASINDLRQAFRLQEWLERNARGGSRYNETILSHFRVKTSDARLQRPEFLGGGSNPISVSEVLNTTGTAELPQGNMAGHAIAAGANNGFTKFIEEHGYIIGIQSVMPVTSYQQGIPKHLRKFDKFDYYWPSFANLGEQPVYNWEVYADGTAADENVFGYIPRYSEYKFIPSSVHGQFRSSLDYWHLGRIFENRPTLSQEFVECNPSKRIFAVTDENTEDLYAHVYHDIKAKRRMPYFGTPKGV